MPNTFVHSLLSLFFLPFLLFFFYKTACDYTQLYFLVLSTIIFLYLAITHHLYYISIVRRFDFYQFFVFFFLEWILDFFFIRKLNNVRYNIIFLFLSLIFVNRSHNKNTEFKFIEVFPIFMEKNIDSAGVLRVIVIKKLNLKYLLWHQEFINLMLIHPGALATEHSPILIK